MLAALVAAWLLLVAGAVPAGAVELGISDSDSATVVEPFWDGLGITRARVVVPYDIATTTGEAGTQRRENFETYRANAAAKGISMLVVFGPSADIRAPDTGDPVAPSADEFAAGFANFRARYPDATTLAAWNEPNNRDVTAYPLGSNPQLAAEYWLRAKALCPVDCTLVAGDFAGVPSDDVYVDAYQAALGGAIPDVWAFHAHSDVNTFQVVGAGDARVTRYYLSKLQGPWAGARIWIDEVGARYRDTSGRVWGDTSQRDATGLLLGLATLDPRIDAIYYYNYSNRCATPGGCAIQDRGLISPTPLDGQAPGYDGPNRVRAAYAVIANRGPVIAPVAALPPAVTIEQPAQGAALRTPTPVFSGRAATTVNAALTVTLQIFPGAGDTESSRARQSLTARVAAGSWSATARTLPDGIYTARVRQAGNPGTSGISDPVVFTIDTVAPTSAIISGPGAVSGSHEQTIEFAASEPGATFTCSVDRRPSKPCVSPVQLRHLKLGEHRFAVRARDAAGNPQKVPTRLTWQVVSLASALAPRLADGGSVLASGLPVTAACDDRCRVAARLDLPGRGGGLLARVTVARKKAGTFALRLRPQGPRAAALSRSGGVKLRLTLVLDPRGSDPPVTVVRTVTVARSGALRTLAKRGLPVTVACSSACSAQSGLWAPVSLARQLKAKGDVVPGGRQGLPRGTRYVALGDRGVKRAGGGGSDFPLTLGRNPRIQLRRLASVAARVTAVVEGPGTAARVLSWPLVLGR